MITNNHTKEISKERKAVWEDKEIIYEKGVQSRSGDIEDFNYEGY
jgi:hypothetical protein